MTTATRPTTKKAGNPIMIRDILDAIHATEKAAASAGDDPGQIGGTSSHPSAKADGNEMAAPEGFRSRENSEQVKKEVPASVDAASEGSSMTPEDAPGNNIGVSATTTGKAPEIETASAKSVVDDPGSTHPARTDNAQLNGGKYAGLAAAVKAAEDKTVNHLANLTLLFADTAAVKAAAAAVVPAEKLAAAEKEKQAAAASAAKQAAEAPTPGVDLAGVLQDVTGLTPEDKQAADQFVVDQVYQIVKLASDDADRLIDFYNSHLAARKAAATPSRAPGSGKPGPGKKAEGNMSGNTSGASDTDPDDPGNPEDESDAAEGGDVSSEADLLAMLEGGGGGGGLGGDIGGDEAALAMLGGDGGGAPPPADDGGAGMGGEINPQDLAMLEQILAEKGITPEQLQAAIMGKMASALVQKQQKKRASAAAQTAAKAAKSARAQQMRAVVDELLSRGRA